MNTNRRKYIKPIRVHSRAFAVLILAGVTQAAPFVINSAGKQVNGSAIKSAPDGTILLTTLNGQTLTFRKGTYRQAFADKPREMFQVEELVKKKDLAAVVEILKRVKTDYQFLGWDQRASLMLARVYLPLKQFENAAREYEELFKVQPKFMESPKERANYMQSLLGSGRIAEVAKMVDEDIASGSREAAARAQVVRGDMKAAGGQYEEALLDYLRTAILFKAQAAVLPEATYKTAVALKNLNDPRAAEYFKKVIDEFPETEYAELAKGEMK